MSSIRAVVFDVGGCLWFEAHPATAAEIHAIEAAALQPLFAAWSVTPPKRLDVLIAEVWAAMAEAYAVGTEDETYREPSLPYLWRGALASCGVEITDEQAQAIWRAGWIPVRHFGYQLYPDTLDVLRQLKFRGLLVGLCTNRPCTNDMLWPDLRDFGMAPYIDAATCSGDTGYFKPHPAPFERALAALGVMASEAMMVGDGLEADVRGAKRLGMMTAWKLNGRYGLDADPAADHLIHELCELPELPVLGGSGAMPAPSPTPYEDDNEDRY